MHAMLCVGGRCVTHLCQLVIMRNVGMDVVCHSPERGVTGACEEGLERLVVGVDLNRC